MYSIEIKQITNIQLDTLEQLVSLSAQIPEFDQPYPLSEYQQRLNDCASLLQFIYIENELAGFKLGYAEDQNTFYSWLGGILPDFRGLGLAQKLLADQEQWASNNGYKVIEVKTFNHFRSMLSMLVKNSYQLTSLKKTTETISDNKLYLQKVMN